MHNETPEVSAVEQFFRRPLLYNLRSLVPSSLRSPLRRLLQDLSGSSRVTLSEAQRNRLHERLQDDVEQFRDVFGFEVEKWGF